MYRKSKPTFYVQYFFPKIVPYMRKMWEIYSTASWATDNNMKHAHFVLDT